jgi:zinc transport system ATP-binding protein
MSDSGARDVVTFDHVWFHRGPQVVLEDVSLAVPERCFVGVIGPNGAGKTTVVRLTLGLLRPTRGEVRVFGEVVQGPGQFGSAIGYVPQRSDIDWSFPTRVIDVVSMGAYGRLGLLRRVTRQIRQEAMERLEWLGIAGLARKPIGNLSGGQQRRTFVARALMGEPRLLLLDEPAAGLDTATHQQLLVQLRALQRRLGLTVVMVSHEIGELISAADRIACLSRTLHWHAAADLLSDEVLRDVYACELSAYRVHHHEICHEERQP